jgi:predicted DNA binding CopG/RHH family protein
LELNVVESKMFDEEELIILEALESGVLKSSIDAEQEIALARQAARESLSKSKNITLRLNMADVVAVKRKAQETGIPYQTLISALIHQYAVGKVQIEA